MSKTHLPRLLAEIEEVAGDRLPALESVIGAFVEPALHLYDEPEDVRRKLIRLLGRVHTESDELQRLVLHQFEEVVAHYMTGSYF